MNDLRYGVFGAAFDPPTIGHQSAIEQSLGHFDKILLVPCAAHAFGKDMTDFEHRLAMLKLFCQHLNSPKVSIDTIEKDMLISNPSQPVYSYDLLQSIQHKYQLKASQLKLILGPDNMRVWDKFYKHDEIDQRWGRFGVAEEVGVHSVQVRTLLASYQKGQPFFTQDLLDKVPEVIAHYIEKENLYQIHPSLDE